MKVGSARYPALEHKLQPFVAHLGTNKRDFLLVLDGHSDYNSGEIIYGQNKDGDVSDGVDGVSFLVFLYILQNTQMGGKQILRVHMRPHLDHVRACTGIRGLVLLTCGPTFTNPEHYGRVVEAITE